jgi:hypothetical protein
MGRHLIAPSSFAKAASSSRRASCCWRCGPSSRLTRTSRCGLLGDGLGLEEEAVSPYRAAIAGYLSDPELRGALLGPGSTLRTLGRNAEATQAGQIHDASDDHETQHADTMTDQHARRCTSCSQP